MANTSSAKKQIRAQEKKRVQNLRLTRKVREYQKQIQDAVKGGNTKEVGELFQSFTQAVDKAAGRNAIHKNKAARSKSRLAKLINTSSK